MFLKILETKKKSPVSNMVNHWPHIWNFKIRLEQFTDQTKKGKKYKPPNIDIASVSYYVRNMLCNLQDPTPTIYWHTKIAKKWQTLEVNVSIYASIKYNPTK